MSNSSSGSSPSWSSSSGLLNARGSRSRSAVHRHENDVSPPACACQLPAMSDFRKLQVWQKAHALSLESARFAGAFTRKRRGLADQITRAADAIPSQIAEGRGSSTDVDFARYVTMAIKEANELENHLQRAVD